MNTIHVCASTKHIRVITVCFVQRNSTHFTLALTSSDGFRTWQSFLFLFPRAATQKEEDGDYYVFFNDSKTHTTCLHTHLPHALGKVLSLGQLLFHSCLSVGLIQLPHGRPQLQAGAFGLILQVAKVASCFFLLGEARAASSWCF